MIGKKGNSGDKTYNGDVERNVARHTLEPIKDRDMLVDRQVVPQNVVLRAVAEVSANIKHIVLDRVAAHPSITESRLVHAAQHRDQRGLSRVPDDDDDERATEAVIWRTAWHTYLASTVRAQESKAFAFGERQTEAPQCHMAAVGLGKTLGEQHVFRRIASGECLLSLGRAFGVFVRNVRDVTHALESANTYECRRV